MSLFSKKCHFCRKKTAGGNGAEPQTEAGGRRQGGGGRRQARKGRRQAGKGRRQAGAAPEAGRPPGGQNPENPKNAPRASGGLRGPLGAPPVPSGAPLGPHGAPWGPMGPHGAPWGTLGPHGPPLRCRNARSAVYTCPPAARDSSPRLGPWGGPRAPCVCVCGRQWLQTLCEPPGARPAPAARRPAPAARRPHTWDPPPLKAKKCASAAGNAWAFDFARIALLVSSFCSQAHPCRLESRPASI